MHVFILCADSNRHDYRIIPSPWPMPVHSKVALKGLQLDALALCGMESYTTALAHIVAMAVGSDSEIPSHVLSLPGASLLRLCVVHFAAFHGALMVSSSFPFASSRRAPVQMLPSCHLFCTRSFLHSFPHECLAGSLCS